MRLIRKGAAPTELVEYGAQPGARYDGDSGFPPVKAAIRAALMREQRGLCCYCEQRVRPTDVAMRIEHRVPQSVDRARDLDWRNLLAACRGGEGTPEVHCDVAKGDQEIALDPTRAEHVATTSFDRSARLCSTRPALQRDLDGVLRLNADALVERRQRALDAYLRAQVGAHPGALRRETLQRWLVELDGPGSAHPLPPHVSYLRAWVERRLRREGS